MGTNKVTRRWLTLALVTIHPVFSAYCQTNDFVITADREYALAVQPDGKTLIGGAFSKLAGQPFQNIARVNANGSLDTGFHPTGINFVGALAIQANGKILVGGQVTNLAGQVSIFARLNADGSSDGTFLSGGGPTEIINTIAVQPDGKIIVGGPFSSLAGEARQYLARLNADGTLDSAFNPTIDASPFTIAIQPDDKILLSGGSFTLLDRQPRNGLGRLNADGTLDASFNPTNPTNGSPFCMALQGDGKILVSIYGYAVPGLTRFNADGTLDTTFNSAIGTVNSFAVQTDGRILALENSALYRLNQDGSLDDSFSSRTNYSGFSLGLQANGQMLAAGSSIYGLTNTEVATQSLAYQDMTITWRRGGASPEVWWTVFEYSTNGTDWNSLGSGVRISGGWQLSGVVLPPGYSLRARGAVSGGYGNDSFWFAGSYIGSPVLTTQPANWTNFVGTSASLGAYAFGTEPLNYEWLKDGVGVAAATNNTLPFPSVQPTNAGNYSVVVSNQFGSVTSSVATVTVLLPPQIIVNDGNFGFTNGQFGFNIAAPLNQTVVVEWLGTWSGYAVIWIPLQTNVVNTSAYYYSEPRSTKNPHHFYRVRVVQ